MQYCQRASWVVYFKHNQWIKVNPIDLHLRASLARIMSSISMKVSRWFSRTQFHLTTSWCSLIVTLLPYCPNTELKGPQIARFMGPTWGPSGDDRTQVGPMLVTWTLLSGTLVWNEHSSTWYILYYIASDERWYKQNLIRAVKHIKIMNIECLLYISAVFTAETFLHICTYK